MASSNNIWKVKVFHQNQEGDWQDTGIGYLEFESNSVSVASEDDPYKTILFYKVSQEIYHKQGETILTWISESGQSLALSFTDKASLSQFFSEICAIQGRSYEDLESDEDLSEIPSLPSPTPDNLLEILYILNFSPSQKLAFNIIESNFVSKFGELSQKLPKDDKEKLGIVFMVYKFLVLTQSREMIEFLVSQEEFSRVLNGLSHDPTLNGIFFDLNQVYQESKFNNLLGVSLQVKEKIEKINKIVFLKETALGRHIDEQSSAFLMVFIQEASKDLLKELICNSQVLVELTEKMKAREFTAFTCFKEILVMSKALNLQERGRLFFIFFNAGVLRVLEDIATCVQRDLMVEYLAEYISGLAESLPDQIKSLLLPKDSTFMINLTNLFISSSSISTIQLLSKLLQQLLTPETPFNDQVREHFNSTIFSSLLSSLSMVSQDHQVEIFSIFSEYLKNYPESLIKQVTSSHFISEFKTLTHSNRPLTVEILRLLSFLSLKQNRQIDLWLVRSQNIDFVVECLEKNFLKENLIFSAALQVLNSFQQASCLILSHLKNNHFKKLREMKLLQLVKKLQVALVKAEEDESFFIKFMQDEDFLENSLTEKEEKQGKECEKRKIVENFKDMKRVIGGNDKVG